MNGSGELPPGHFWDSEDAEQEYHAVVQGIAEAEERLKRAQTRLLIVDAVANRFAGTPGAVSVMRPDLNTFSSDPTYRNGAIKRDLASLNHALNPYWLPAEGRIHYSQSFVSWRGSLVVAKVENETLQGVVYFGRTKKRSGTYVDLKLPYSYEKRVVWYTPTEEVGMSGLERGLLDGRE